MSLVGTMDDGRFTVSVVRSDDPRQGMLQVHEGETLIHQQPTTIAFGAPFGWDVDDVADWEEAAAWVIDHPETRTP